MDFSYLIDSAVVSEFVYELKQEHSIVLRKTSDPSSGGDLHFVNRSATDQPTLNR
jgi:hypothetical protein